MVSSLLLFNNFFSFFLFPQSFFGFGQTAEIAIALSDAEKRKKVDLKTEDGGKIKAHLFYDGEDVGGTVSITDRDAREETRYSSSFYPYILPARAVVSDRNAAIHFPYGSLHCE